MMFPEIALATNVEIVSRSRHPVGASSDAVGTGSFQAVILDYCTDVRSVRFRRASMLIVNRGHIRVRAESGAMRRDSGMMPNSIAGEFRTRSRAEGEQDFRTKSNIFGDPNRVRFAR